MSDIDLPVLDPADEHHVVRVLRVGTGETVTVSDGAGRWRECVHAGDGLLDPSGAVVTEPERDPAIAVAFAVMKGDRPDWVVQKLTELGVDRIVPMHSARSVVRWDRQRAARHVERLRKISREAAMQSRQVYLPIVEDVADVSAVAGRPGACLADPDGEALTMRTPLVLIGPEGGFTADELALGPPSVRLPVSSILRADTACIAAATILAALRENLTNC